MAMTLDRALALVEDAFTYIPYSAEAEAAHEALLILKNHLSAQAKVRVTPEEIESMAADGSRTYGDKKFPHWDFSREKLHQFADRLSRVAQAKVRVTDEDVDRAFNASVSVANIATDKRAIRAALESFAARLSRSEAVAEVIKIKPLHHEATVRFRTGLNGAWPFDIGTKLYTHPAERV